MKKTVSIFSDLNLSRKDNTLHLKKDDGTVTYLPVETIDTLQVFGEVGFTKALLDFFSQQGILIHFFNYYGYYSGTFYPKEHNNAGLVLLDQVKGYLDESKRLALASKFVAGYATNARIVLQYYQRRGTDLESEIKALESGVPALAEVQSIEELMGKEGNLHKLYYPAFNKITENEFFRYRKRSRRPPEDPINALISFMNSLIYMTVLGEIYKTHLDPRIGFLHTPNFRSFSLNLDIAELFKPAIGDRLLLAMINKRQLSEKHFSFETGKCYLTESGRKVVIKELEERLAETIQHPVLKRPVSYRSLIRMEVYKVEKYLVEGIDYKPYRQLC
ncbi:MAG: type I-B CRISPR-associated endonuclease Cas1b [Bacteroidetes bacterium]|nr:type I-B CRISPR-associated endonuclease Cas1b [Bacteroidota bacterium]